MMKPINEVYPDHAKEECDGGYFYGPGDYQPLLESMGYDIALQVDDEGYKGDSRLLFKNGDSYGMLIFGWGSCSGCDALQACNSMREISDLRDRLINDIWWGTADGLLHFIETRDWELQYSWHAEGTKEFVAKSIEYLKSVK